MIDVNLAYEVINGAWTVALAFIIIFLVRYLYDVWKTVGWRSFLFNRALPEQFAIAILIADVGNFLVRGSTWAWRTIGADLGRINSVFAYTLIIGAVIGTIGILCKLRIVTVTRFGPWPWIACLCSVLAYCIFWVSYDYLVG